MTGFGLQAVNALHPDAPLPGPRLCHGPELSAFPPLKWQLEATCITLLRKHVGLARDQLPLLWDWAQKKEIAHFDRWLLKQK